MSQTEAARAASRRYHQKKSVDLERWRQTVLGRLWIKTREYVDLKAEIAALQERVKALDAQVLDLQARAQNLVLSLEVERQRSDNAVDRLLNTKGLPTITPPKDVTLDELSDLFEETPEGVAAVRRAIEEQGIEEVLLELGHEAS